jgi:hypothetical protein
MKPAMLALTLAIFTFADLAHAKDKHAPLPTQILSAKTAYIDNQSGHAEIADRSYDELMKWGRFEILSDPKKADIILRFTSTEQPPESASTSSYDFKTNSWHNGTVTTSGSLRVHFLVLDPATGNILWSASEAKAFHSQSREDIKELRKRIEEQEKPR